MAPLPTGRHHPTHRPAGSDPATNTWSPALMGHNHALSGAVTAMAVGVPLHLHHLGPLHLGTIELWMFVGVCAGAAVLPDIDHPDSTVSKVFGPVTGLFAWFIEKISGGHRNGTHAGIGAGLFALLAFGIFALYTHSPALAVAGAVIGGALIASGWAWGALDRRPKRAYKRPWHGPAATVATALIVAAIAGCAYLYPITTGAVGVFVLLTLALAAAVRVLHISGIVDDLLPFPIAWAVLKFGVDVTALPYALTLGVLVHIAGDMITYQGCPWGWPWSQRTSGPKFMKTNGTGERRVAVLLVIAGVVLLAWDVGALAKVIQAVS